MYYAFIYNKKVYGTNLKSFKKVLNKGYYITHVYFGPSWCEKTYFCIEKKDYNEKQRSG
jgi:hypothetical protein